MGRGRGEMARQVAWVDDGMREIRLIKWVDSCASSGWTHPEDVERHGPSMCTTVGFVLREDDKMLVVTTSIDQHDNAMDPLAIPKVAVTLQRTIRKATL